MFFINVLFWVTFAVEAKTVSFCDTCDHYICETMSHQVESGTVRPAVFDNNFAFQEICLCDEQLELVFVDAQDYERLNRASFPVSSGYQSVVSDVTNFELIGAGGNRLGVGRAELNLSYNSSVMFVRDQRFRLQLRYVNVDLSLLLSCDFQSDTP